jgi:hypothetical protein
MLSPSPVILSEAKNLLYISRDPSLSNPCQTCNFKSLVLVIKWESNPAFDTAHEQSIIPCRET